MEGFTYRLRDAPVFNEQLTKQDLLTVDCLIARDGFFLWEGA